MKTLPSLDISADDYMFAPLDECRVIPKGEKEIHRFGPVRVYESAMVRRRQARRYVYFNEAGEIVACFLVTGNACQDQILSLTRVRNDYKRKGYGTLLYTIITMHFPGVKFRHTSPASESFANAVIREYLSHVPWQSTPGGDYYPSATFKEQMKRLKENRETTTHIPQSHEQKEKNSFR